MHIFHKWIERDSDDVYSYQECKICNKRRIKQIGSLYWVHPWTGDMEFHTLKYNNWNEGEKTMKKIFLICPVRDANESQKNKMNQYIEQIEAQGNKIYYPARDTNQNDNIGFRICCDNRKAIVEADEVHIFYDKTSQGSLFDLGMAFALNRNLTIVNIDEIEVTPYKSFGNMIIEWSKIN